MGDNDRLRKPDPNNTIFGVTTDRGFTEHEHLDELGLIHMNGRVYDPTLGRFMTPDPGVPYPLNLQSFNRHGLFFPKGREVHGGAAEVTRAQDTRGIAAQGRRFSNRKIATAIGSARSTVQECVRRAHEAGLVWPLSEELDEEVLQARLYRREVLLSQRSQLEFAHIYAELSHAGVTRLLLWREYKAAQPEGWQYSVFCDQYRRWLASQELMLRLRKQPATNSWLSSVP